MKTGQLVEDAKTYLRRRSSIVTDLSERQRLENWAETLGETSDKLKLLQIEDIALDEKPTLRFASEKLDLARKHIQELHESNDIGVVEFVVGDLFRNLQVLAGPHGPGGGMPGRGMPGSSISKKKTFKTGS
ncbi:MAG TPA: hypothetical protein VF988_01510 [Verrucomicrobiae bacterium]